MVDYDIDLYVTGSNAHLLSSDLATYITGRYVRTPVYPLSFREFFDAVSIDESDLDSRHAFSRYLVQGGFPFQVELDFQQEPTLRYLEDAYSTILFKDLVQRNDIRDTELREALGLSNAASIDQVLENIVFMELLHRGYDAKVGDKEIDFIARKRDQVRYFQVSYLLANEETIDREFAPLEEVATTTPSTC